VVQGVRMINTDCVVIFDNQDRVEYRVRHQVWWHVEDQVWYQLNYQVRNQVGNQVWFKVFV